MCEGRNAGALLSTVLKDWSFKSQQILREHQAVILLAGKIQWISLMHLSYLLVSEQI